MAYHKITQVNALPGYLLLADFSDGAQVCYNVSGLFDRIPAFQDLRDITGLFALVKVDAGGYGVSWNDDLDLSADEIYNAGIQTRAPAELMRGACCPACGQKIRCKSAAQAAASRANGHKGGRPRKSKKATTLP